MSIQISSKSRSNTITDFETKESLRIYFLLHLAMKQYLMIHVVYLSPSFFRTIGQLVFVEQHISLSEVLNVLIDCNSHRNSVSRTQLREIRRLMLLYRKGRKLKYLYVLSFCSSLKVLVYFWFRIFIISEIHRNLSCMMLFENSSYIWSKFLLSTKGGNQHFVSYTLREILNETFLLLHADVINRAVNKDMVFFSSLEF